MARYVPRTYKNGRAARIFLRIVLVIAVLIILTLIVAFFYLQRYIVQDENGLRLVIPWLQME